ncbi:MAG: acyl-CoA dehydrogenase family protein [Alphaproteobacteria bacterium]|nr:acyl-CoA dehydrogenase family protein [Alphaproteobacteria bacterium]
MDFDYSDEQRQLKDGVERFVRERYQFDQWKKIAASESGMSEENWRQMAELGWLAVSLPEAHGGLGGGAVETMIIMEGFGRGLVLEPYLSTVILGATLLARGAPEALQAELLPKIGEGKLKLALAIAEHQGRYNFADVALSARAEGSGYVLAGPKCVVLDAPQADKIIVSARTGGGAREAQGISLFLVDRAARGLNLRAYRTLDRRRAADLAFDNVRVDAASLIGARDQGHGLLSEAIDHGIAAVAAEAVGAMQCLHDATNDYLKTRKQFGVPIGSFQVLQHRMVDMHIALEQARSLALMVNMKLDGPAGERARAAAAAKVQIGQSARFVGQQAVQLHGGMGMTDELTVGHYKKRLMMIDVLFGNAEHHRRRFAEMEGAEAA